MIVDRRGFLLGSSAGALSILLPGRFALGQDGRNLRIGAIAAPNSLDPHFYQSPVNNQTLRQIFDSLVNEDVSGKLYSVLAESWRPLDESTWEFRLRPGVKFHDGTPLEGADIAFTIERIPLVKDSPGSFLPFVKNVASVEPVDAVTVRIRSKVPNPFLDRDFSSVWVLSRKLHNGAETADFTSGKLAIGTGAFRYRAFEVGQQLDLVRNDDFWGRKSGWSTVRTRFIPDAGARIAGLLAGDLDLIDGVPVQDVARLEGEANVEVFGVASATSVYLFPDASRDVSPFVTDKDGRPLDRNPLKDVRVRRALSLGIDRKGIVDRLLSGQGVPADQFAAPPAADRLEGLPAPAVDIGEAKRLLTDAGYPDGFGLTIHGPSGFFTSDVGVLQAIAQGFNRIGVVTKVETLPAATFFSRATNREFSVFLTTYAATNSADLLRQVVLTKNPETGTGPFNRQGYSNPAVDGPGLEALRTFDPEKRRALTHQALQALQDDVGVIAVYYPRFNWAGRRGYVRFVPGNAFGHTNAVFTEAV